MILSLLHNEEVTAKIVKSVYDAIVNDILQDTRKAGLEKEHMNSHPSRVWDLINRNLSNALNHSSDYIMGFTNRGPWNFVCVFDKQSRTLISLMREERFLEVKKDKSNRHHYIHSLAQAFNSDLEKQQLPLFEINDDDDFVNTSIAKICNDLLLQPEMVEHYVTVLFSGNDGILKSIRCVAINSAFEICHSESWNAYIPVEESVIVDQIQPETVLAEQQPIPLTLKSKAHNRKKQLPLNIEIKKDDSGSIAK